MPPGHEPTGCGAKPGRPLAFPRSQSGPHGSTGRFGGALLPGPSGVCHVAPAVYLQGPDGMPNGPVANTKPDLSFSAVVW
jgi:hypothetical protein